LFALTPVASCANGALRGSCGDIEGSSEEEGDYVDVGGGFAADEAWSSRASSAARVRKHLQQAKLLADITELSP